MKKVSKMYCHGQSGRFKNEVYNVQPNKKGKYVLLPKGKGNRPSEAVYVSSLMQAYNYLKDGWLIRVTHSSGQTASRSLDNLFVM